MGGRHKLRGLDFHKHGAARVTGQLGQIQADFIPGAWTMRPERVRALKLRDRASGPRRLGIRRLACRLAIAEQRDRGAIVQHGAAHPQRLHVAGHHPDDLRRILAQRTALLV